MRWALFFCVLTSCSSAQKPGGSLAPDAPSQPAPDGPGPGVDAAPACASVGTTAGAIATADHDGEYILTTTANSRSATNWGEAGNEAVVLEIAGAQRGFIGHLVLHQGSSPFAYSMHVGALSAGESVTALVSPLTASKADQAATACAVQLVDVTTLGAAAVGVKNAPIFRWPAQKAFNDIPVIVGWSKARSAYQTVMTNEDGGTAEQCGGGASGMEAEIGRWGRSTDIEGHYHYGASAGWERCTGSVPVTTTPLRMEGAHPQLYWGDGHNRVFEDRSGYGQACGTGTPEKPDGDFAGWNVSDPSTALADDTGKVIVLRPVPVDLDALGYATFGGRREALADTYAPWVYRITSLELDREGKIDNGKTFGMSRYLYVDVRVADVGGSGDSTCSLTRSGGFKLRAEITGGAEASSNQITGDYASSGAHDWKRVAIPLPANTTAADIDHFVFDSYDGDGIYLTAIGDAFIPVPDGTPNGAKLVYVRRGERDLTDYVDDDSSSCTNGVNTGGPGGTAYTCVGGQVNVAK